MCVLLDLSSSALLEAAVPAHCGPDACGELALSHTLLGVMAAGDVLLAGALYGNYWLITLLGGIGAFDAAAATCAAAETDVGGIPAGSR